MMSDSFDKSDTARHVSPEAPAGDLEVSEPEHVLPSLTMDGLSPRLAGACARAGWASLTPVQSLALPYMLARRDIMTQSRTGSGKTGCYLLPLLESLDPDARRPQALVLVPTRELALQVESEAKILFADSGIKACALYGGVGYKKQMEALNEGCQVVIGTPGRILDHITRHSLELGALRSLVFDEADRMLSIGFYPDIRKISGHLPKNRQTTLFSATYPPHVLRLAEEFARQPEMLSLSRKEVHVAEVDHLFCQVKPMDRDRALVRLLETENPSSALIFCNTRANVHYVAGVLKGFGYRADEISSDLSQKKREQALERIRQGALQYLVATDVAARGIDIPDLSHVFLYEPPEDHEGYIHRAGRTGRAGASGVVISLVDVMQKLELDRIGRHYKINLREISLPSDEDVSRLACERLSRILEERLRSLSGLERLRALRYAPLARDLLTESDDDSNAVDILAMLLDDCHRQSLNENRFPAEIRKPAPDVAQGERRKRRPRKRRHSNDAAGN